MNAAAAAFGVTLAVLGVGLALVFAFKGPPEAVARRGRALFSKVSALRIRRTVLLGAAGLGLGVAWAGITGWPVFLALCAAAPVVLWPVLSDPGEKPRIAQREALAAWVRSLSGLIQTGTSLEMALRASFGNTPDLLKEPVAQLIRRLRAAWPTVDALQEFAADLDDATSDIAVMHLQLAAKERGPGLAAALEALADVLDDEVRILQAVQAERTSPRREFITVLLLTVGLLLGIPLLSQFSAPYATPFGQLIFIGWTASIAMVAWVMWRTLRPAETGRLLGGGAR